MCYSLLLILAIATFGIHEVGWRIIGDPLRRYIDGIAREQWVQTSTEIILPPSGPQESYFTFSGR
jgi:hypothetical protein